MTDAPSDVIVVGGGHNGLVAATYLARAGHRVSVFEGRRELGGAVASAEIFEGVAARLSRFSYLISLLPTTIIDELGLRLELRSRQVGSYTPVGAGGLLVERQEGRATRDSFRTLTGDEREYQAWAAFKDRLHELAAVIEPTLTQPLPRAEELRSRIDAELWAAVVEQPLGELIESTFSDDTVRGLVLTDALIGTFASAHDPSLRQNRCFLYHVIGNGTGEWRVPVGGMGAVTAELIRVAEEATVEIHTGCPVEAIKPLGEGGATLRAGQRGIRSPARRSWSTARRRRCSGCSVSRIHRRSVAKPRSTSCCDGFPGSGRISSRPWASRARCICGQGV